MQGISTSFQKSTNSFAGTFGMGLAREEKENFPEGD
jgi:hypothetical protein